MPYPPHLNRAPMGMPALGPGIGQFTSFRPGVPVPPGEGTPLLPVPVGLLGPSSGPCVQVLLPTPNIPALPVKPLMARVRERPAEEYNGPTTTVFVGNITDKASDVLIRQMLAKCGTVVTWKRVQGASGKQQAFGFCEYSEPASSLRAIRLLHDFQLGDKKLLVKVDAKTKAQLEEWKAKKMGTNGVGEWESKIEEDGEELDEVTQKLDQTAKEALDQLLVDFSNDLKATTEAPKRRRRDKKDDLSEDLNKMEIEEEKKDLISREISKFRDTHKKLEEERERQQEQERDRDREKEREREKDKDRERNRERDKDKDKDKDRERDRVDKDKERDRDKERREEREKERDRDKDSHRDKDAHRDRDRRDRDRDREKEREKEPRDKEEDEEELHERRKLERRLREKEAAYQERLKNWEAREKKKARDYEKEMEREAERRREMAKEAKRLKEFLEDYDDDRDDPKYYKGSALQKRQWDRVKEVESDDRDRKREREELEEIRKRLVEEGHPDPDGEIKRQMEKEAEKENKPPIKEESDHEEERVERGDRVERSERGERGERGDRKQLLDSDERGRPAKDSSDDEDVAAADNDDDEDDDRADEERKPPRFVEKLRPIGAQAAAVAEPSESSASSHPSPASPQEESPRGIIIPHENSPTRSQPDEKDKKPKLSLKLTGSNNSPMSLGSGNVKRKKLKPFDNIFSNEDDDDNEEAPKRRKLVPLDFSEEERASVSTDLPSNKNVASSEEKRKHIKSLIEKIPTAKPELFAYTLDWTMVDSTLMERRVKPWINKKIIEYIGEEEPTLVEFICTKILAHSAPQSILDDVSMVLDDEAEVFVVKMWRLLIYETEAKKFGLVK
uniref:RNA binding motif protein 25 n=1 Tax=Petromyzon marinus TaxID=7757 RepID=S4RGE6_PETMA